MIVIVIGTYTVGKPMLVFDKYVHLPTFASMKALIPIHGLQ